MTKIEIEQLQNLVSDIEFTSSQEKAFILYCEWLYDKSKREKQTFVMSGRGGCVDCDTEYLTEFGWRKISEYKEGDKVLQYNLDGTAEFVYPEQYHKIESEFLTEFKTKYGVNQCLSDEHEVVYISPKGKFYKEPFYKIKEKQEQKKFYGRFITSFNVFNKNKVEITDWEIRLMCAVIADGSVIDKKDDKLKNVRLNLKRQDKKDRIKMLLNMCDLEYTFGKWNPKDLEYENFVFRAPIKTKVFPKEWYSMPIEQLKIIADEVLRWDGEYNSRSNTTAIGRFFTTVKENADFIQFVFSAIGYRASINISDRRGRVITVDNKEYITKSIDYVVHITNRNLCALTSNKGIGRKSTEIIKYKTTDGFKYCFTVPSSMLVLRRGDCIFITGNSGKSYIMKYFVRVAEFKNMKVCCAAFTGKASDVLRNKGLPNAQTLHSLMYIPKTLGSQIVGWKKREEIDCDILFVDEFSFLDKTLIRDILQYKIPVVFVGDSGQLCAIGEETNYLNDKIDIELKEIVRQSAGNPIIEYSNFVREGNMLKVGMRAKKGDGVFAVVDKVKDKDLIERLKKEYTQIICGTNNFRHKINAEIRLYKGYKDILHVGETLVILKNNKDVGVFNGQIVEVKEIIGHFFKDDLGFIVQKINTDIGVLNICLNCLEENNFDFDDFLFNAKKEKHREDMEKYCEPIYVNFSYCISIFKMQGSQSKNVLVFAYDFWFLYRMEKDKVKGKEKFLRAIYTSTSRAEEKCVLVL